MRVAIVGSRAYPDLYEVVRYVNEELGEGDVVVSGGARGVDKTAESAAKARGLEVMIFVPNWKMFGRKAGFMRNTLIVDACETVIAFWDGSSNGTRNTVMLARRQGKPVRVIPPPGQTVPEIVDN